MTPVPQPLAAHHPHCLGCGTENPASIGLRFEVVGERVRSPVRFDRRQEGAPGFVHGGAVATVLDDVIGTLLMVIRRPAVTARLAVDYRAPLFLDRDYATEAWVDAIDGRKLHLAGRIDDADGTTVAEATALFVVVDMAHFQQAGQEAPAHWSWSPGDLPR